LSLAIAAGLQAVLGAGADAPAPPVAAGDWVNYGPFGGEINALVVNPVSPAIVYAGSAGYGFMIRCSCGSALR